MDLGQINAIHNDILDFSNNIHHIYFSLLNSKPIFHPQFCSKEKLGFGPFYSRIPGLGGV